MKWLKDVVIDLVVTALIAVAVFTGAEWARWIVLIYSPFMLILKVFAVLAAGLTRVVKTPASDAPPWFFHVLYAANCALLVVGRWWLPLAMWLLIWLLSFFAARNQVVRRKVA